jgi:hypothetical protein
MRNAVLVLTLSLTACGGVGSNKDAGAGGGGGSLFTGGGGGTSGGGSGGGTGGGTGGGDAGSGFAGDACDTQRTVALSLVATEYRGSAISDTSLATPSITPSCAQKTKDVVFKLDAPTAGTLRVTVTPHGTGGSVHFDPVISVFTGASCAAAVSAACSDSGAVDAAETLTTQVSAGPLWVWVSGADPSESGSEFDVNFVLN